MSGIKETIQESGTKLAKRMEITGQILQLKTKLQENERELNRVYHDIGKKYYEQQGSDKISELTEFTMEIDNNLKKEKELIERKNKINGLKICKACGVENANNAKFCMKCGKEIE